MGGNSNHQATCVCEACTCGRHKSICKPVVHVETHLDSDTEYRTNYLSYQQGPRERGRPQPQQLKVGGEFYGDTESRDKYQAKPIPTLYQHPKQIYQPNPSKLEGLTTQKTDYQSWPTKPREMRQKPEWAPSPHQLDGKSVYNDSFGSKSFEKVQSCAPKYQPLVTGKFEGISTHDSDYRGYGNVARREDFKPRAKYENKADDRDFTTVMKKDHNLKPLPACPAEAFMLRPTEVQEGHLKLKA